MKKNKGKNKKKYLKSDIRATIVFCVVMSGILFSCIQIALINIRHLNTASGVVSSKTLTLGESRGIIYDTDMRRLVNIDYNYICAVMPAADTLSRIRSYIGNNDYSRAIESVADQSPILLKTDRYINDNDIMCERIYSRYTKFQPAAHIIGYTDSSGHNGLSGIEYAYNSYLEKQRGICKARFSINGKGTVMLGADIEKIDDNYNSLCGVVLTVDKRFQIALENAMDINGINKGAAVLLDIKTGEVKACASRPTFNPDNIGDYLNRTDSALFNRAFGSYPIGSVFKLLVAASALEQGIDPKDEYYCDGNTAVSSITFNCTKSHGHVDMSTAIAYSCNCYFINLIEKTDCNKIITLAESLGFGNAVSLDDNIKTYSGYPPDIGELDSAAARANFSFGQGKLTANPFQIAMLYSMIANDGKYCKPYLVKGFCNSEGEFESSVFSNQLIKVISEKNSRLLQEYLEFAVREGTGQSAKLNEVRVAGKTSTAQSGEFIDGKERLVTWFAGFFPYDNPQYVAVIVCENGISGGNDCAPVFSQLVKSMQELIIK